MCAGSGIYSMAGSEAEGGNWSYNFGHLKVSDPDLDPDPDSS